MKFAISVEFLGNGFCGFQSQKNNTAVQDYLNMAISKLLNENTKSVGAGRTDAGVNAVSMVAHFETDRSDLTENNVANGVNFWLNKLSAKCVVTAVKIVPDDFHARFSCNKRWYQYRILQRPAPPVLDSNKVAWFKNKIDFSTIQSSSKMFVGEHNFNSFRSSQCQAKSPVRTIDNIIVFQPNSDLIYINIIASSFLHNQIRHIVGALTDIASQKKSDRDIQLMLDNPHGIKNMTLAPASGLFFMEALYESLDFFIDDNVQSQRMKLLNL
ncbi:MAG: tRNA pseudouridine(38-40) synthase TruA [Alphaproteobacteria bacterium]|nr:tRNA pseudouridine(38-40) synthase TruA [Alphaproteobacteria bacterium]MBL0717756.1 tRNA pseudouridine(38-40) synthase TruA [Alphaproteobacteria bacterium]